VLEDTCKKQANSAEEDGYRPEMLRAKGKHAGKNKGHAKPHEENKKAHEEKNGPVNQRHGYIKNDCPENHCRDGTHGKRDSESHRKAGYKKEPRNNQKNSGRKKQVQHRNSNFFHLKIPHTTFKSKRC